MAEICLHLPGLKKLVSEEVDTGLKLRIHRLIKSSFLNYPTIYNNNRLIIPKFNKVPKV